MKGMTMALFSVTISRIVSDVVENTVEIEADNASAAEALALEKYAEGEIELYFRGSAYGVDEYPAEAIARSANE